MKTIDFGVPGGMPFTQDRLGRMQTSYMEGIMALAAIGGDVAGPIRVAGMVVTEPTPGEVAVSSGWFIADGKLISFPGGSVVPGGGEFAIVQIVPTTGNLTFNNGSVEPVLLEPVGNLIAGASASYPNFKIADLKPFGRENWSEESYVSASVTASIRYKRDFFNNMVVLRGTVIADGGVLIGLPDYIFFTLFTLPVGYRPIEDVYFTAHNTDVTSTGVVSLDSTGLDYIQRINCRLTTAGEVQFMFTAASVGYGISFSAHIPLD
jgi:hypothetical protein